MLAEQIDPGFALYFLLYVATSRMLRSLVRVPSWYRRAVTAALDPLVRFAGEQIFHAHVNSTLTGSTDRMYDRLQAFCLVAVALAGCALWCIVERPGRDDSLYRWVREVHVNQ